MKQYCAREKFWNVRGPSTETDPREIIDDGRLVIRPDVKDRGEQIAAEASRIQATQWSVWDELILTVASVVDATNAGRRASTLA